MPAFRKGSSAEDRVALHGEQADLGLQSKPFLLATPAHALVVPNDVVQVEGDLLPGLVTDDVGDFLGLDRRQLDEAGQPRLAGDRNGHPIAQHRVAREKLLQRLADQFGRVGAGLTEDFRVFDVVEGLGNDLARYPRGRDSVWPSGHIGRYQCPKQRHLPSCRSSVDAHPKWREDPTLRSVPDSLRPEADLPRNGTTRLPILYSSCYRGGQTTVNQLPGAVANCGSIAVRMAEGTSVRVVAARAAAAKPLTSTPFLTPYLP